ncbi:MAG: hypothetical protein OQJ81_01760 [Melioribacteraceae bacterium]|nr:hypothetical protein [Melioribacteraceae bacterium]
MTNKNISLISKHSKNLLQSLIIILLLLIVWKTFSSSRSEEIIKEQLDKTELRLDKTMISLNDASRNVDSLKNELDIFEKKARLLALERDSLLLKFRRQTAANWDSLQNIIKRQKNVENELAYLRNKNKDFD